MVREPYSFLADTIRVVAVDKDDALLEQYRRFFDICCLFQAHITETAAEAESWLRKSERMHVCLNGLGVTDIDNDEFYLLKTYGRNTSFIVVSDTTDPRIGYTAGTYGAKGFLRYPEDINLHAVLCTVLQAFIYNIVNPDSAQDRPFVRRATVALVRKGPRNVTDWAHELHISESYFRRAWKDATGFRLKHVLFLHSLYSDALTYYELVCRTDSGNTTQVLARPQYSRQYEYYVENREALDAILAQKR